MKHLVPSNQNVQDGPAIYRKDTTHPGVLHARRLYAKHLESLMSGERRVGNGDEQEAA